MSFGAIAATGCVCVCTCACLILQVSFWDCPKSFLYTSIYIAIDLAVNIISLSV